LSRWALKKKISGCLTPLFTFQTDKIIISKAQQFVNKIAALRHITRLISLGYFGGILMRVVLEGKTGFVEVLTDHFLEDNFLKL
jgi:hypothetical protein